MTFVCIGLVLGTVWFVVRGIRKQRRAGRITARNAAAVTQFLANQREDGLRERAEKDAAQADKDQPPTL